MDGGRKGGGGWSEIRKENRREEGREDEERMVETCMHG